MDLISRTRVGGGGGTTANLIGSIALPAYYMETLKRKF